MTTITIPDDLEKTLGMDEPALRLELACALFARRKLELWPAAKFAGLSRGEMEDELFQRNIPIYYVDENTWAQEEEARRELEKRWPSSSATPPQ